MIIGVPKEIKEDENRVAVTPGGFAELVKYGHRLLVEAGAGAGSHIPDEDFKAAGADIVATAADAYEARLVVKVKEPIGSEYGFLRAKQTIFCFLHLAANPKLTAALAAAGGVAIAYETVQLEDGRLPLLAPMSEVAGRLAPQMGARFLEAVSGGRGLLLGGVAGVPPAKAAIIGGGIAGSNAALIALGMGATVTIIDSHLDRLRYLEEVLSGRVATRASNTLNIAEAVIESDVVVGAVLRPGAKAPKLVSRSMVKAMKTGSVIVDISIDQGGCVETISPTTLSHPITVVEGVIHCGVTNIPSAVPHTSTYALTNSTLPWVLEVAERGWQAASEHHAALAAGLNVVNGQIVHPALQRIDGV